MSPSARTQGVSGRPPRSRSPALDLSLDGIVLQHVAIAVRATVAAGGPMTYDECMGKLVTVRIMSDAICGKPGITAMVLSERIDYLRLSTAYQLGMPDGRTGAYGCHVSDRHGLADTFRCVADVRAG